MIRAASALAGGKGFRCGGAMDFFSQAAPLRTARPITKLKGILACMLSPSDAQSAAKPSSPCVFHVQRERGCFLAYLYTLPRLFVSSGIARDGSLPDREMSQACRGSGYRFWFRIVDALHSIACWFGRRLDMRLRTVENHHSLVIGEHAEGRRYFVKLLE